MIRLIGDCELLLEVSVRVSGLCVCVRFAVDLQPVQGISCLSSYVRKEHIWVLSRLRK